mmetsp:Transcript_9768/g.23477  ORF Transcript_9768/g.23477 Transcript_9768/m.23477 type:complete len:209 (-) Transcript_9768:775-1401(-)
MLTSCLLCARLCICRQRGRGRVRRTSAGRVRTHYRACERITARMSNSKSASLSTTSPTSAPAPTPSPLSAAAAAGQSAHTAPPKMNSSMRAASSEDLPDSSRTLPDSPGTRGVAVLSFGTSDMARKTPPAEGLGTSIHASSSTEPTLKPNPPTSPPLPPPPPPSSRRSSTGCLAEGSRLSSCTARTLSSSRCSSGESASAPSTPSAQP